MTEQELTAHCVCMANELSDFTDKYLRLYYEAEFYGLRETPSAAQLLETVFELLQVAGLLRQFNHEIAHNKR